MTRHPLTVSVLIATLGLTSACVSKQAVEVQPTIEATVAEAPAEPTPPPIDQAKIDRLYAELTQARRLYSSAIGQLARGEEVAGEERLAAAKQRLTPALNACLETPGCEAGRFIDTFENLLAEQSLALKLEAARILVLEEQVATEAGREPGTSPFVAAMPDLGNSVAMFNGTDLSEIIQLNGPVKAAIDDWLTWMRPLLMDSWRNYQHLRATMAPIYDEAGLPEALLFAMMATETGGKVHSYSRAGAAGPLQFIRSTGRTYGLKVEDGFDMRLDPAAATRANVAYLNDRFAELNHSLEKSLAAYNGGENRMKRLERKHRNSSFWDSAVYYSLPRETREYVPRIFAAAWLFLHPADFNLEFPAIETETTRLELVRDASLGELTICLGQESNSDGWFRTLRNLNPRLDPGEKVSAGESLFIPAFLASAYEARCLDGAFVQVAAELHSANYPDEPEMIRYVVARGDTLGRIAGRHRCVSIGELAEINRIRAPRYTIRLGQQLKIPSCN